MQFRVWNMRWEYREMSENLKTPKRRIHSYTDIAAVDISGRLIYTYINFDRLLS